MLLSLAVIASSALLFLFTAVIVFKNDCFRNNGKSGYCCAGAMFVLTLRSGYSFYSIVSSHEISSSHLNCELVILATAVMLLVAARKFIAFHREQKTILPP